MLRQIGLQLDVVSIRANLSSDSHDDFGQIDRKGKIKGSHAKTKATPRLSLLR